MKKALSILISFWLSLLFLTAQQAHAHMPSAPSGLTATAGSGAIRLSWTAPSNSSEIAGYNIYRCEEGEATCMPVLIKWVANPGDTPPPPTSYTDDGAAIVNGEMIGIVAGTTYRYQVTASHTIDYHESLGSNTVTVLARSESEPEPEPEPEPETLPLPPTGFTAVSGASGIDLSWTAPSSDVAGYSVYRCEEGETPCTPEWIVWVANEGDAPPAPTEYLDADVTSGATYRYAVTSNIADSSGDYQESDWSDEVTALAEEGTVVGPEEPETPPPAPTGLAVTSTSETAISLNWTAPPDDGGGPIEAYNVYRCEEPCELTADNWVAWVDDGTVFTDTHDDSTAHEAGGESPVVAGTTYRYAVAAYRDGDSDWSNEVTAVAQEGTITEPEEPETLPLPPTGFTAVSGASGIDLSWTAPSSDVAGYSVYRCEEGETPCTPEWIVWVANEGDAPPAPTEYLDADVTSGATYRYAVTSNIADSSGDYQESDWSDEVTVLAEVETEPEPEPEPEPETLPLYRPQLGCAVRPMRRLRRPTGGDVQ